MARTYPTMQSFDVSVGDVATFSSNHPRFALKSLEIDSNFCKHCISPNFNVYKYFRNSVSFYIALSMSVFFFFHLINVVASDIIVTFIKMIDSHSREGKIRY